MLAPDVFARSSGTVVVVLFQLNQIFRIELRQKATKRNRIRTQFFRKYMKFLEFLTSRNINRILRICLEFCDLYPTFWDITEFQRIFGIFVIFD